jgi:hypothetical protein
MLMLGKGIERNPSAVKLCYGKRLTSVTKALGKLGVFYQRAGRPGKRPRRSATFVQRAVELGADRSDGNRGSTSAARGVPVDYKKPPRSSCAARK